ncbi:MAG: VWA domain-containing protein [Acidobacteriota bacterium]
MNRRIHVAGVAVLLAGAVVLTAGQNPPPPGPDSPTFKVQVDYVEVDAVVTDQQGRFVRDLKKEDFQVFEDRKAQTVSAFTLVDIPVERFERPLFAAQPIEPDIRTNARPFDGRIYIVVLDDLHVQPLHTQMVRRVMRKFITEKLGANDLMAVVHVQGKSENSQEFTSSKRLLLAAVDTFFGRAERPATVEAYEQYLATIGMPGAGISDPIERKRGFDARATLDELQAIADWFGSVRGRKKTILFVSEGIEYDIEDMFNKIDASMIVDRTRDLIRSATKSNVSIYAIDPRGLSDMGDLGIELNSAPPGGVADEATGQVTGGLTEQQVQSLGLRGLQNELRLQHNSLRTLAEETGGVAFINSNNFAATFDRIVQDNSSYYVLAYYPPNPKRDGKFHNIQVRVNRPGVTVRARRGYANPNGKVKEPAVNPASRLTAEARAALDSPLPVSGLTIQVFAAAFKGTAPKASVLLGVEMRGRDLQLGAGDKLQLSFYAVDAKGKYQGGNSENVTLNLRPETRTTIQGSGMRTLSRFDLPPGRYQLRVVANELATRAVGSVLYDLDVPDFTKGPLVMSGVALTSAASSRVPTVRPDDELKQVLPAPPMGNRVFPVGDELFLFAEIYDNAAGSPHKVDIKTTVTADEGNELFKSEDTRDSSELQGKSGGYGYSTRVPLAGMSPGLYVLKVEARSRLGQGPTTNRQVQFRIEAASQEAK